MTKPGYDEAAYTRGWKSTCDLDTADRKGYTRSTEWMDGRTDAGQGLPKWHRRDCPAVGTGHGFGECEGGW
jgi:hypothetical protein